MTPTEAIARLSPRELETLALLGSGLCKKRAARQLGISPHTVQTYAKSIRLKLGVTSVRAAVAVTNPVSPA